MFCLWTVKGILPSNNILNRSLIMGRKGQYKTGGEGGKSSKQKKRGGGRGTHCHYIHAEEGGGVIISFYVVLK